MIEFSARNPTMNGKTLSFELTLEKDGSVVKAVPVEMDFTNVLPAQILTTARLVLYKAVLNDPMMAAMLFANMLNRSA